MTIGKGIDRTDLSSFNGGEVAEDNACDVMRGGSGQTILTQAAGERPRPLKLGTASADEGPKLAQSKVVRALSLGRAEFLGSNLQKPRTSSLKMPTQHPAAMVEERTHALPEGRRGRGPLSKTSSADGKRTEDMVSEATAGSAVGSPEGHRKG